MLAQILTSGAFIYTDLYLSYNHVLFIYGLIPWDSSSYLEDSGMISFLEIEMRPNGNLVFCIVRIGQPLSCGASHHKITPDYLKQVSAALVACVLR